MLGRRAAFLFPLVAACGASRPAPDAPAPVEIAAPADPPPLSTAPAASESVAATPPPAPSAEPNPWPFGVPSIVSIDPSEPAPPRFRPLRMGMTPKEVGAVFPGAEQTRPAHESDGGADAVSEVLSQTVDGVITHSFTFERTKGKLGLTTATLHFSKARRTALFHAELVRGLTASLGKPLTKRGAYVLWPLGEIADFDDHYGFVYFFEPKAALFLDTTPPK